MAKCLKSPPPRKTIKGVTHNPVKVIEKGKDWVDWMRPDGMMSREWDFSSAYKALRRVPVGCWTYYPRGKK